MQDASGWIDADTVTGQSPGENRIGDLGEWHSPAIQRRQKR
jgi:hypothetical protein